MEQAIEQSLARYGRVDQFQIFHGLDQGAAFDPGIVLDHALPRVHRNTGRSVAGIEIGPPHALRRTRQELRQNAAGAPAMADPLRPAAQFLRHGETNPGRNLFRAAEIFVRRILQAAAIECHQALVAAAVEPAVDGHGQVPASDQDPGRRRAGIDRCRNAGGIVLGASADPIRRGVIDHQHAHRPVGLGLENEAALQLERGAEQDRQHRGLAQKLRDRNRILVPGQQLVDGGAEPHDPAPQVEGGDLERQDGVVGGRRRRSAHGNGDLAHGAAVSRHQARMPFWA